MPNHITHKTKYIIITNDIPKCLYIHLFASLKASQPTILACENKNSLPGILYAFYCEKQHKINVLIWCIFICMISWHRYGTKNTIFLISLIFMVLAPCRNGHQKRLFILTTTKQYVERIFLSFQLCNSLVNSSHPTIGISSKIF